MEIKNVEEEEKKEYPEENEMKQEVIEKRIPKKWVVLGITAVAATVIGSGIYLANIMPDEDQGVEFEGQMSVTIFNSNLEQYAGQQKGTSVKSLLQIAISTNNAPNRKKVKVNGKESVQDITNFISQIRNSNIYTVACNYDRYGYITEIIITGEGVE